MDKYRSWDGHNRGIVIYRGDRVYLDHLATMAQADEIVAALNLQASLTPPEGHVHSPDAKACEISF